MTAPTVSSTLFTVAPLVLAALIFLALCLLMDRSPANLCIAGFVALVIPSPMMLVVHGTVALAMIGLGVACAVPAYLLAEDHQDEDGRGGRGSAPTDPEHDPGPDAGWDPERWAEFERDFWSHVERHRELVEV